jgi:hypothetical protein
MALFVAAVLPPRMTFENRKQPDDVTNLAKERSVEGGRVVNCIYTGSFRKI